MRGVRGPIACVPLLAVLAACIPAGRPPEGYDSPSPVPRPNGTRHEPPPPWRREPDAPIRSTDLPKSIPQTTPGWVARKVVPDAREVGEQDYMVKPGDTLGGIAEKTGAGADAIAKANGIQRPYAVMPKQKLHIPGGRYHRVKEGETGIAIARAYGVSWQRVVDLNGLEEPYILRTNQRLLIPSRTEVAGMSIEQRAAAFQLDIDDLITGSEPAIAQTGRPAPPTPSPRRTLPPDAVVAAPARFAGRFAWPLGGKVIVRFGPQGNGRRSDGINIAAAKGEPVRAAADGVVAYVGSEIAVYGGLILIKHGQGWITAYGNADALLVKRGQSVRRGQVIARAGETGSVTTPQLHFEIRKGRAPIDPLRELPLG